MAKITFFIKKSPVQGSQYKYLLLFDDEAGKVYFANGALNYKQAQTYYKGILNPSNSRAFEENPDMYTRPDTLALYLGSSNFDLNTLARKKKKSADMTICEKCKVKHFTKYPHVCRKKK